jgi:hypothetical protein
MWTTENRAPHDRSKLRYPSDLTDEEYSIIGPLIPPAKTGGNTGPSMGAKSLAGRCIY